MKAEENYQISQTTESNPSNNGNKPLDVPELVKVVSELLRDNPDILYTIEPVTVYSIKISKK